VKRFLVTENGFLFVRLVFEFSQGEFSLIFRDVLGFSKWTVSV
jgi:hypothetical protein